MATNNSINSANPIAVASGSTTSTRAVQSIASVGISGQILTSKDLEAKAAEEARLASITLGE